VEQSATLVSDTVVGDFGTVWVSDNYAYVGNNDSGVQIFDISNPVSPILKSNYGSYNPIPAEGFNAKDIEVIGNYAYIASWDKGLKILDISDHTNPVSKATLAIPGQSYGTTGLQIVGNYAYVTNINSGLSIIDITNPSNPTLKGSYAGEGWDVQVIGDYAYIANGYSGLQIVNISDPTAPTLVSNFLGSQFYRQRGIEVVGTYAYVASELQGLLIIDISDPSAPIIKGTYDTPGEAIRVSVEGNYAYVSDETYGLQIINISNPTNPTLAENYDTSGSVADVKVIGGYAYVADGVGGLKIIDVSEFVSFGRLPTDLALSNNTIAENQSVGTAVGIFTSTDPDTGNTFTYSLVTGTGSTDNALFTITGNQLQSNGIFDFETKNNYSIRVKTTDQDGLSYEKALTININDVQPTITLAVSPNTVSEDGSTNLLYTLTRDNDLGNSLTVNYAIAGTAGANDYTGATPGTGKTITFAAGSATVALTIDPTADTTIEANETVALTLATGTGYTVGTIAAVTGTITNDDLPSITLRPNSQTVVEGLTSPQNLSYTVSLSSSSTQTITVQYSTANGTALSGSDYTTTTGTLTFNPGVTRQTISIPILNDAINEANETFTVKLTSPTNAILGGTATVTTTITDTLSASTTTTLAANVENLLLTGNTAVYGTGNAGNNVITGNRAANILNGKAGIDTLTGGIGTDTFVFQFGQSLVANSDRITDFAIGTDKIDLLTQNGLATNAPTAFTRAVDSSAVNLTTVVNNLFTDANGAIAGNQALAINSAALVKVTTTGIVGTYLVVNDGTAGFQATNDLLVNITGFTGTIPALGTIAVNNFFV
jgi:Ca2+-binding RTX toxin-like protein